MLLIKYYISSNIFFNIENVYRTGLKSQAIDDSQDYIHRLYTKLQALLVYVKDRFVCVCTWYFIICKKIRIFIIMIRAHIMNARLLLGKKTERYYNYLPLTPRVFLPPPPQSAVQVSMSMHYCASWYYS